MRQVDVLVVGGGSAGVAAAVSAARSGAQTLLVERGAALGGMAPAALVHSICGLYRLPDPDESSSACGLAIRKREPLFANPGFAEEFAARLIACGGATGPIRMGRVEVLLQRPTAFATMCDRFVRDTPGLEVRLHTDLVRMAGSFQEASLCCRGHEEQVRAHAVIDATGDAIAAALGGAACEQETGSRLQRPAFIFVLQNVTVFLSDDTRLKLAGRLAAAVSAGTLSEGVLGAALRSSGRQGEVFVTIDLDAPGYDPFDAACLTDLEIQGRALAEEIAAFLRAEAQGFQDSFISAFPTRIGVRESRRIIGEYRLETADLTNGARFDDAVALATWPMELRETNRGARLRFPLHGAACDIPLRSLRARGHPHLFVAGRCIASSHEAQASIRVIGTCLATGEAAGFAAALVAREDECCAAAIHAARESQSAEAFTPRAA